MLNKLTIRLKVFRDESLLSYVFRMCKENGLNYLVFLNMIKNSKGDYAQFSEINVLDIAPLGHIDANSFKEMTGDTSDSLINNSFYKVLDKFCIGNEVERSRLLAGIIDYGFRYCPLCLNEKTYNKLIWRVKNIKICNQHNIRLLDRCLSCNNLIKYEELRELGICPHCGIKLDFKIKNENFDDKFLKEQKYLYETWYTLFYGKYDKMAPKDVSYKILYILNRKSDKFNRSEAKISIKEKNKLATILQSARGTLSQNRALHLATVIQILYENDTSMQQFLNINVPYTFILSIKSNHIKKIYSASCIAPWCKNVNVNGMLVKTRTSVKKHISGSSLLYYMFCPECGCEYAYDKIGNIHERTDYIESYHVLSECWNEEISLEKLSYVTGRSEDQLKRILAYFNLRDQFLKSNQTYKIDKKLLGLFLEGLKENLTIKEIRAWKCWRGYRKYLLYRYHKDVIYELNTRKRKRNKRKDPDAIKLMIQKCLDKQHKDKEKVTINSVCNALGISAETIRNWDGNDIISKYKKWQEQLIQEANRKILYEKIDNYLQTYKNSIIKSKDLYGHLGIIRNILWRRYPDITAHITCKIKSHNKTIKSSIDNT